MLLSNFYYGVRNRLLFPTFPHILLPIGRVEGCFINPKDVIFTYPLQADRSERLSCTAADTLEDNVPTNQFHRSNESLVSAAILVVYMAGSVVSRVISRGHLEGDTSLILLQKVYKFLPALGNQLIVLS